MKESEEGRGTRVGYDGVEWYGCSRFQVERLGMHCVRVDGSEQSQKEPQNAHHTREWTRLSLFFISLLSFFIHLILLL